MKIEIGCPCGEKETVNGNVDFVSEKFDFYISEDGRLIIECYKCKRHIGFNVDTSEYMEGK